MIGKLLGKIVKPEVKSEVVAIKWVTGKDKDGNYYIRNTETNDIIYCPTGEREAERLATYYNKL